MNPLNHPVYDDLPIRTQRKLLSPVSEDKLTWDCFYALHRADALSATLGSALGIQIEQLQTPHLIMWGFEIDDYGFDRLMTRLDGTPTVVPLSKRASWWEQLGVILDDLENYRDGKPEGQKTEPDVIVVTETLVVLFECKRNHGLGRCSRFEDTRCPEIHVDRRKREYCQYWEHGLPSLVSFGRPTPTTLEPLCNEFYQLLRNHMIGSRLAAELGRGFRPFVVKNADSPHYGETEAEVKSFNHTLRNAPKYQMVSWSTLSDSARKAGVEILRSYREKSK